MALFDSMNKDIGGYTTVGDTSQSGFETGFSPGTTKGNTNITYADLLKAFGNGKQQQTGMPLGAIPQAQQTGNIYTIPNQLPAAQKKEDSTGAVISLLLKMFGL